MNNLTILIILAFTIIFGLVLFAYYVDVILTLSMLPENYKSKQDFLNKLIPFKHWKGKIRLFKNYNNLPSAKEK